MPKKGQSDNTASGKRTGAGQEGYEAAPKKGRHRRSGAQDPADRMGMCRKDNDTSTPRKREEEGRETRRSSGLGLRLESQQPR